MEVLLGIQLEKRLRGSTVGTIEEPAGWEWGAVGERIWRVAGRGCRQARVLQCPGPGVRLNSVPHQCRPGRVRSPLRRFKHLWNPLSWCPIGSSNSTYPKTTHHEAPNSLFLCNHHFSDPHAHLPLIKARRQESSETPSHPALGLQTWLYRNHGGGFIHTGVWAHPRDPHLTGLGSSLDIGIFIFNSPGDCNHSFPSGLHLPLLGLTQEPLSWSPEGSLKIQP